VIVRKLNEYKSMGLLGHLGQSEVGQLLT
jgi:hypothetical protein